MKVAKYVKNHLLFVLVFITHECNNKMKISFIEFICVFDFKPNRTITNKQKRLFHFQPLLKIHSHAERKIEIHSFYLWA